jgi:uncharacterized membrane protein YphA (DoxX/SURF4 family)
MKILVLISRLIVGSLFIVSGLVKANDPLGFSYKLGEYFSASVFDWPAFEPYALTFAILLVIGEVVLGVALLIGGKMKLTTWTLLGLTVMFGFLTWYSWAFDAVKDCGCFGDALKGSLGRSLTPLESFMKDMVLLVFVLVLLIAQMAKGWIKMNTVKEDMIYLPLGLVLVALLGWGVFGWPFTILFTLFNFAVYFGVKKMSKHMNASEWIVAGAILMISSGFTYWNYAHLPLKDYRPYRVGANIVESRKTCEELGLQCPVYANVYLMTNKTTGETKEVNSKVYMDDKIWEDENWEITETLDGNITLENGYESPIHDFIFTNEDGVEVTEDLLIDPNYSLLVVAYDLQHLGEMDTVKINDFPQVKFLISGRGAAALAKIKALTDRFQKGGFKVHGATSSTWETVEAMRHEAQLAFPWLSADGIMLKTIVRANPGVLLLKQGVVIGKWHHNDVPTYGQMSEDYMN